MKIDPITAFNPGHVWLDTDGYPIQAHGGGLLRHDGYWYWVGENKDTPTMTYKSPHSPWKMHWVEPVGFSCYRSTDLLEWENVGVVLPSVHDPRSELYFRSAVMERPKVVWSPRSKSFVLWFHLDTLDYGYRRLGWATADRPEGPFNYRGSLRPHGCESLDMTVYQNPEKPEEAYLYYVSENLETVHACRLQPDFTAPEDDYVRLFEGRKMEAVSIAKAKGRYWMIAAGCSGWDPNEARSAVADHPLGPWEELGNPCVGKGSETTFDSQSMFLLPMPGNPDRLILVADRWNKHDLGDSRHVWLPVDIADGRLCVQWRDTWQLS